MGIQTIVEQVLRTRLYTMDQEEQIHGLMQRKQYTRADLGSLSQLITALSCGYVSSCPWVETLSQDQSS